MAGYTITVILSNGELAGRPDSRLHLLNVAKQPVLQLLTSSRGDTEVTRAKLGHACGSSEEGKQEP
jgi:hypothetical protein